MSIFQFVCQMVSPRGDLKSQEIPPQADELWEQRHSGKLNLSGRNRLRELTDRSRPPPTYVQFNPGISKCQGKLRLLRVTEGSTYRGSTVCHWRQRDCSTFLGENSLERQGERSFLSLLCLAWYCALLTFQNVEFYRQFSKISKSKALCMHALIKKKLIKKLSS